jgi:hypothetical protein
MVLKGFAAIKRIHVGCRLPVLSAWIVVIETSILRTCHAAFE